MKNRRQFIRELAKEAGFTQADTKYFLNGMIAVFARAIENREELNIRGLGKLTYRIMSERKGYNPYEGIYEEYDDSDKVLFQVAHKLKDIRRMPDKRVCKSSRQYREELEKYINEVYGEDVEETTNLNEDETNNDG